MYKLSHATWISSQIHAVSKSISLLIPNTTEPWSEEYVCIRLGQIIPDNNINSCSVEFCEVRILVRAPMRILLAFHVKQKCNARYRNFEIHSGRILAPAHYGKTPELVLWFSYSVHEKKQRIELRLEAMFFSFAFKCLNRTRSNLVCKSWLRHDSRIHIFMWSYLALMHWPWKS